MRPHQLVAAGTAAHLNRLPQKSIHDVATHGFRVDDQANPVLGQHPCEVGGSLRVLEVPVRAAGRRLRSCAPSTSTSTRPAIDTQRSRSPTGTATTIEAQGSLRTRRTLGEAGPVNSWIVFSVVTSNHTGRGCGGCGPPATDREPVQGASEELEVLGGQRIGVGAHHFPSKSRGDRLRASTRGAPLRSIGSELPGGQSNE